ncbi:MAG: sulfotransferase domain-containing protein [Cyanobacteria bacterium J06649_11]
MSQLPNLIVIGAMKSGTTSIHDYLDQHPDIFMSKVKEIDFFIKEFHWDKGIAWYQAQFNTEAIVRGESSQNYSKRHHFKSGVPNRIHNVIPNTRLIYLVRDPIDRIISHYHEALEGGYAPKEGLNQYLTGDLSNNHYVLTSSYYYQLQPYLEVFPLQNILICTLENLKLNRLSEMNRIFRFLRLSECSDDALFDFVRNEGAQKRKKNVLGQFIESPSSQFFRRCLPRILKDRAKESSLSKKIMTSSVVRESLNDSTFNSLVKALAPDMNRFRSLANESFSEWSV